MKIKSKLFKNFMLLGVILSATVNLPSYALSPAIDNPVMPSITTNTLPSYKNGTNVTVTQSGLNQNVTINGGKGSVGTANWNSFNVGKDASVNFIFNANNQTSLNYVDAAGGMSQIYGSLKNSGAGASTSKVILLNPNGVLFGSGANVNLNSITASTLNGTYNASTRKLDLTKNNNNGNIVVENGAKITGNRMVNLVSGHDITVEKGASISSKNSSVNLYTADSGNIVFQANGGRSATNFNNISSKSMKININGEIEAKNVRVGNKTSNSNSAINLNGASIKSTQLTSDSSGNIWLVSGNDINVNNSSLTTESSVSLNAGNDLTAKSNKINAEKNVKIYSERQLTANSNKINAEGNVKINSYLDEMTVKSNTINSEGNVSIISNTNTLNVTSNKINAEGNVTLQADKDAWGKDFGIDFALNAKSNTINSEKNVNLYSSQKLTAQSNKINAEGKSTIKAEKAVTLSQNKINLEGKLNIVSDKITVNKNNTINASKIVKSDYNVKPTMEAPIPAGMIAEPTRTPEPEPTITPTVDTSSPIPVPTEPTTQPTMSGVAGMLPPCDINDKADEIQPVSPTSYIPEN